MFKLDNFGVILFVSFSYKKLLQCSFYENWKNWCKNRFFRKKFKKVCVLQRRACNKFKFQTQLSRKLQRFRTYRKNKKRSIFHDLSEYIIFFHMVVNYWTGPLTQGRPIVTERFWTRILCCIQWRKNFLIKSRL